MNGSGADAFAGGFARGFGMVNDFYDRQDKKEYRNKLLGMQEAQHELAMRKGNLEVSKLELAERGQVIGAVHELWQNAKTPEEKKSIETMFIDTINQVYPEEIGAGKKITAIQSAASVMGPDKATPGAEDKVLIGVGTQQPDGRVTPGFVSQHRSSDPKDPYMAISMNDMVDFLITNPKGGTFGDRLRAAASAAGYKMPERYGEIKREGSIVYQEGMNGARHNVMGNDGLAVQEAKNSAAGNTGGLKPADLDRGRKAMEKSIGISLGGYDNLTDSISYDSDEKRKLHDQLYQVSSAIWSNSGYGLDPLLVAYTVAKNGKPLTEAEATTMAKEQLISEGVTPWHGGKEPSGSQIRERAKTLMAQQRDMAEPVLRELAALQDNPFAVLNGGIGRAQKPATQQPAKKVDKPASQPEKTAPAYNFDELPKEKQDAYLDAARKNPVKKKAFIDTFGQEAWDKHSKKAIIQSEKKVPVEAVNVQSAGPRIPGSRFGMLKEAKADSTGILGGIWNHIQDENRKMLNQ